MKLTNKVIRGPDGKRFYILSGKPTDNPKVSVYLLNNGKPNYSLWYTEILEEEESFRMWPYKGDDFEELKIELLKDFVERDNALIAEPECDGADSDKKIVGDNEAIESKPVNVDVYLALERLAEEAKMPLVFAKCFCTSR